MRVHRVVLSAALALVATVQVATAEIDECSDLVEANDETNGMNWLGKIERLFVSEEPAEDLPRFGESEYWVTVQPGRFSNVTCDDYQYEDQDLYPIGVVVKPLALLDLPAYTAGGRGTPVLVLTEYGHRKVVRLGDIQPIAVNATYIFADGALAATYCRAGMECPGNQPADCTSGVWRCGYSVGAISGYALAPSLGDGVADTIAAFDRLNRDPILQEVEVPFPPETVAALMERACQPLAVRAYRPGGTLHQAGTLELSLCTARDGGGVLPLKVVTLERAERLFRHGLTGSFHRRLATEESRFSASMRDLVNTRLVFAKECGEELTHKDAASLGGSLGAEASAGGLLSVSLGAKRESITSFIRSVGEDEYLLYTTYFVRPIPLPGVTEPDDLWVFDIVFRAACDDNEPRRRSSVAVFYKDLPRGYVPIGVKEDIFANYIAQWGDASFAEGTNPAQIYEGHFWVIHDHLPYYYWRDTLRRFFYKDLGVTRQVIQRYPIEQQPLVRDFFVFLFMSAAFDYREPRRFVEN